ncbi:insulinase family protein [Candidatus Pacearchaeota archaeon]|nr:insulinase family protein [Candidatus Pacearchaeota archaeon]
MLKNFRRKTLKNGMTVIFEKRNIPIVSVGIAVRCGGMNEALNEKGISHFIEHMPFKGTPTRTSKQISEEIEKNGGVFDASTGEDLTVYLCKIPSNHLFTALNVLSDILKNPLFDQEEIDRERKVIFEEIKMRRDDPFIYCVDKTHELLYHKPFGVTITGAVKTLKSINRKKIVQRFREVYQPNNMILCVVGNANFDKIVRFAEANFGNKKGKSSMLNIKRKNASKIEKRKGITQANLILSYHSPLYDDKKSFASTVLTYLMAHGMSSRLFIEIREKRNLAYQVNSFADINKYFSHTMIYVGTSKEHIQTVKKLILEEFRKVADSLTESELNQVKEQIIGNHKIFNEDSLHQMSNLLYYESQGKAEELYDFEKNIKNVKLQDVRNLAKLKNYSFFALIPS